MTLNHEQAIDHLEEYVLGTLSADLVKAVDDHLDAGCEECRARLVELAETSAHLSGLNPRVEPSLELKGKIMAEISAGPSATSELINPTPKRTSIIVAILSTAAAVALAIWGFSLHTENRGLKEELSDRGTKISRMEKEIEAYMDATSLLASPGMQFFDLAGVAPNDQAFGKVVIEPDGGHAVVYMYELPPTPEGMDYQLWMMRDNVPTSVGTFSVAEDGSAKLMLDPMPDIGSYASFDVTIEPAGGAPKPTGMMYLTSPQVIQFQESE